MAKRRRWTKKKRERARRKAEAALKERRRTQAATRDRQDTSYAGMIPIAQYGNETLKLRPRLPKALSMKKGKNSVYKPEDEAMAYVGTQIAGIARLNDLDRLLPEGLLAKALGIPQWMSENTQRRFLDRATEETLEGVDGLARKLVEEERLTWDPGPIEVDGDVTGIPQRSKKREGVESGYCGGRARPCYQQPRVTVNGLPWWTDLRRGSDACMDLPKRTLETGVKLAREYPKREIFCRMDGFYVSREYIGSALEEAQRYPNLRFLQAIHPPSRISAGRLEELVAASPHPWRRVNSTTKIKELGWVRVWEDGPGPVRAVAVRRKERKKFYGRGGKRKKPRPELKYLILGNVSRKRLGTRGLFKKYHQRQREEFSFKDGKQSLSTAKMPSMKLHANRMHVKMVGLAQLMLQLFAWKFLPHRGRYGPTCKTIREKVIVIGGKNRDAQRDSVQADILCVPLAQAHGSSGA